MIQNYFKTAWRSLLNGKSFSVINVSGLAVGMAAAIIIFLWIQHEISYDKFHSRKDDLYEVYGLTNPVDGKQTTITMVPQPLAAAIRQSFPEAESASRIKELNSFLVSAGEKSFTGIHAGVVDPSFLSMFSFPLAEGIASAQLQDEHSVTITETLAKKLFGSVNAIGKIIRIDSVDQLTVTGILKDLPSNTRFNFEYLLSWEYFKKTGNGYINGSWLSNNTTTFVQLKPGTDPTRFSKKISNLSREHAGRNDIWTHFVFPLSKWHLYSDFENGVASGGRIDSVKMFALIAAFILLIACINFMNLSTARSERRAKEVGIRKVAGAGKHLLILQFIIESFLTTCISCIFALILVQLALTPFNRLFHTEIIIPLAELQFWLAMIGFVLITSLLAGSYPAFYLSSFKPISIIKKQFKNLHAVVTPRQVMVVLQFSVAILLIISTIVIRNQVNHAQNRNKGYSELNLLQVDFQGDIEKNYALIKTELINAGVASSVTKTMTSITERGSRSWGFRWPGEKAADTNTAISIFSADADLIKTTGLELIAGRDLDITRYSTDSFSVLLNESAVKLMGFKQPVGQRLFTSHNKQSYQVVGVVKDFVAGSAYEAIQPMIIQGPGAWFNTMHIKLQPGKSTENLLAKAQQIFKTYNPSYPFDYRFTDQLYARMFEEEQRTKTLAGVFAALAILISCLGLFGLSAYVAHSRVKEIGVRKVLGASEFSIAKLLSKDFVKLVLISILIASPVAWFAMQRWLESYEYRTSPGFGTFALAGGMAVLIALITVSFQAVRAAISNPVKSLRSE